MKIYSSRRNLTLDDFIGEDNWVQVRFQFNFAPFWDYYHWMQIIGKYNDGFDDVYRVRTLIEEENRISAIGEYYASELEIVKPYEILSTEELCEMYGIKSE